MKKPNLFLLRGLFVNTTICIGDSNHDYISISLFIFSLKKGLYMCSERNANFKELKKMLVSSFPLILLQAISASSYKVYTFMKKMPIV